MKKLINQLRSEQPKEIIIVGDIMLDEYFFGAVNRISPEAPVPILKQVAQDWCLGGAANVAANCKHVGCSVSLIGVINDQDFEGQKVISMLTNLKINTQGIVRSSERPTTCKKRFLAKNHQMLRMDAELSNQLSQYEFSRIVAALDATITPGATILISDYAKGVVSAELVAHIISRAKLLDCTVLVDPKGPDFLKYKNVDYLKPNLKEFDQIVDFFTLNKTDSIETNARQICRLLSLGGLVITLGEKGILYVDHDQFFSVPGHKKEVYDLTGAGDTVFAFLALGLAHDIDIEACIRLANLAAAVAVSHIKTYAVSLDELIDHALEPTEKIYNDWALLKIELDWQRADGKRVVLTNGCFDILHPGHIHTLKEAKKFGDILVVALNTDQSVKRLKGDSRPINNLEYRATMMSAIGLVDFVVSFDQDTPQMLIDYLRPDVLVKGGDYKKESIAGYQTITSYGGSVEIVDYVPGLSTTGFLEKLMLR